MGLLALMSSTVSESSRLVAAEPIHAPAVDEAAGLRAGRFRDEVGAAVGADVGVALPGDDDFPARQQRAVGPRGGTRTGVGVERKNDGAKFFAGIEILWQAVRIELRIAFEEHRSAPLSGAVFQPTFTGP